VWSVKDYVRIERRWMVQRHGFELQVPTMASRMISWTVTNDVLSLWIDGRGRGHRLSARDTQDLLEMCSQNQAVQSVDRSYSRMAQGQTLP
jgi:hypothetical protein